MKQILTLTSILIFGFSLLPVQVHAAANAYYVTQNGNGDRSGENLDNAFSVSDFNSSTNWSRTDHSSRIDPGDTVYFSGTITDRVNPPIGYGGSSGNPVTLDGWKEGTCNPVADAGCPSAAILDRPSREKGSFTNYCMSLNDNNYMIIQDFNMQDSRGGIGAVGVNSATRKTTHLIIRRNYIHDMAGHGVQITTSGDPNWKGIDYVTFGGALGDGNFVYDTVEAGLDPGYQEDSHCVGFNGTDNLVVSYNFIDNSAQDWTDASNGMSIHTANNGLVEYNTVGSASGQACISKKEWGGSNMIFRFNKLYNCQIGISVSTSRAEQNDYYIYGNLAFNAATGIRLFGYFDDIHIWSNVLHDFAGKPTPTGSDVARAFYIIPEGVTQGHVYLYNNTIARANVDGRDSTKGSGSYINGEAGLNLRIKNNLYYYNSQGESKNRQIAVWSGSDKYVSEIDYNTFYSVETPYVYYDGSDRTIDWISAQYSVTQNKAIDPGFTDPNGADNTHGTVDDDYTLNGTNIDDGEELSACFKVKVQGILYTVCYNDALDPNLTDWTTTPPTVVTTKQENHGSWERGAYVYKESSGKMVSNPELAPPSIFRILN